MDFLATYFFRLSAKQWIGFLGRLLIVLTFFSVFLYFAGLITLQILFSAFTILLYAFLAFLWGIGLFVYEIYLFVVNGYWEPKTVLDSMVDINHALNPQTLLGAILDKTFGLDRLSILLTLNEFWQRVVSLYVFVPLMIIGIPLFFLRKFSIKIYNKIIEPMLAVYWRKFLDYLFSD